MTSLATAAVTITVDGQPYREPARLRSVRVASRLAQPAQCELVVAAPDGGRRWPDEWGFGVRFTVRVAGDRADLFEGEVTAVELTHEPDGSTSVRVRGYDLLHRLRKRQQLRVFEGVTAAEVAEAVTADLGLELVVEEPGPRLDRVVQHGDSDFDLLLAAAAGAGLYPVLHGRQLRLVTLAGYGDPVPLRLGQTLADLRVEANLERAARRVTAVGWHSQRAEPLEQPATRPRGRPGVRLDPDPGRIGMDGNRFLTDQPARSDDQLAAAAQAALDASANQELTASGVAGGDAELVAGRRIRLDGVAGEVAGDYLLGSVVHTLDGRGYLSTFSTELPPRPEPPGAGATSITLGRITAVDDPDRLGRVRVSLPGLGDLDAGWLAVLCPGAGRDRGLVVLPDVDDTVVVALPHRSPAAGIVLGSLYGTVEPPDSGVDGDRVRRWSMRTAGGQSVVLDDSKHEVRVGNRAGSYAELGPDKLTLHAATDLVIEAPGHGITIRASSVDFDRALLPGGIV
jgi:phage protein D/phage baseplate assembly protein gpV